MTTWRNDREEHRRHLASVSDEELFRLTLLHIEGHRERVRLDGNGLISEGIDRDRWLMDYCGHECSNRGRDDIWHAAIREMRRREAEGKGGPNHDDKGGEDEQTGGDLRT